MRAPSLPSDPLTAPDSALASPPRALVATRIGWSVLAALCVTLFIVALPLRLAELTRLLSATTTRVGAIVVSPTLVIAVAFCLEVGASLVFFALATLLAWRRNDRPGVLRIAALLFAFGAALPGTAYAVISATPIWRVAPGLLQAIGWTALLLFAYLFPSGDWVPTWTRWLALPWLAWTMGFFAFAEPMLGARPALIAVSYLIWVAWLGTGVCAQIYRYMWVASATQRQQSKWVTLGFVFALVGILLVSAQQIFTLAQGRAFVTDTRFIALALVIITLSALPIPVSITIAVLRHNLFDIDRLINLTLVYGALTLSLGAIYGAVVALSQVILQSVTGRNDESQLALVVSTLGAAALFQPLRRRIQTAIDRQFYRRRYDAAQIIAAFSASLRNELDLTELAQRLVEVAHRTMKPRHVSLWLVQAPARRPPAPGEAIGAGVSDRTDKADMTAPLLER